MHQTKDKVLLIQKIIHKEIYSNCSLFQRILLNTTFQSKNSPIEQDSSIIQIEKNGFKQYNQELQKSITSKNKSSKNKVMSSNFHVVVTLLFEKIPKERVQTLLRDSMFYSEVATSIC